MFTPPFLELAERLADPVEPANFPETKLRFRNHRAAQSVRLDDLSDSEWLDHFARFKSLPGNLPQPLAMRYHGHQFGTYNPELGDGRGFLFAQLESTDGRVLDLGTKGSGQTPWSRQGDGRLTLKGGVREVLASSYLEAMGVKTSKTFSLVETGEHLARNDEPSPTRSAVMVRLSHSHIRFGTFQRLAYHEDTETMARLVDHIIAHYHPQADDPDMSRKSAALLELIANDVGKMIGQWMATGFVHGVMNTDNFNITGETFDFGPYRFSPISDPNLTAAYFDQNGLYRFGRQPYQGLWSLQQLGGALTLLCEAETLGQSLSVYEPAYQKSFAHHTLAMLGLAPGELKDDLEFLSLFYAWMTESKAAWPQTFFDWYGGAASLKRAADSPQAHLYSEAVFAPVKAALTARSPASPDRLSDPYFQCAKPASLIIDEIEALWAPIADADDWSLYDAKLAEIEAMRLAYGFG